MHAANEIEIVTFTTGESIFQENETSYHFFIIQEGQVEIFKRKNDGAKVPLAIIGPGHSLGEFAMIDRQPRSASARALTEVRAAKISAEAYELLVSELPDWAVSVMRALVERMRHMNNLVRRYSIVDEQLLFEIESLQEDGGTITETNPYLNNPDDPDSETQF